MADRRFPPPWSIEEANNACLWQFPPVGRRKTSLFFFLTILVAQKRHRYHPPIRLVPKE